MSEKVILEVKGIVKNFEATKALCGVDFTLKQGEIHALVGENGAGKSTLMNIIDGVFPPDAGEIFIDGKKVCIRNPHEAQNLGIGFVHQEIALCPDVTVAENILMSSINNSKKLLVNYKKLHEKAGEILKSLAEIDPRKLVSELSVSNQQVVEIAKALSMNCKILIFDEPTSALTEQETESLFKIMRDLKQRGIGIIYISHRMAEVFGECDRVSVLRDGCYVGTYKVDEIDSKTVVNKMVGREISEMYPSKSPNANQTSNILFEIRDFSDTDRFHDISFKLNEGEILGISGLVGAGRSEIAQAICGLRPKVSGEVFYRNQQLRIDSPVEAIENGIVYLTEDRKALGIFLDLPINKNISAMKVTNVAKCGLIDNKRENEQANSFVGMLNIKCRNTDQNVSSLSGGNQQKVLIAKLLTVKPKVIFMDEPTRGIDVGAKSEIHKLLRQLANQGTGIILISSELPEIIGMCDRVIVIHEGKISGEVTDANLNEPKIIQLASGI